MAELLPAHCGECVGVGVLGRWGWLRRWPAPLRCRAGASALQGLRRQRLFRLHHARGNGGFRACGVFFGGSRGCGGFRACGGVFLLCVLAAASAAQTSAGSCWCCWWRAGCFVWSAWASCWCTSSWPRCSRRRRAVGGFHFFALF